MNWIFANNKSNFAQLVTNDSDVLVMKSVIYSSVFKQSVQKVDQQQQNTIEVCCEMIQLL